MKRLQFLKSNVKFARQFDGSAQYLQKASPVNLNFNNGELSYKAGVFLSFSDGYASCYSIAAPIMATYGIKGTAYPISDWIGNTGKMTAANLQALYAAGWDIGNGTQSHVNPITGLTEPQQETQFTNCATVLSGLGLTRAMYHTELPGSAYDSNTLTALANTGMLSMFSINTGAPIDPLNDNAYLLNGYGTSSPGGLAGIENYISNAIAKNKIPHVYIHDIDGVGNISTADFTTLCAWIQSQGYATYTISDVYDMFVNNNYNFETSTGYWAGVGNHSCTRSTTYKKTGNASLKIIATSAGDATTNYALIAANEYATLISGNQYTIDLSAYGDTSGVTLAIKIGDQVVTGKVVYSAVAGTFAHIVFKFLATSSTVNQPIQLYLSGAGNCYVDNFSITQTYDALILTKIKYAGGTSGEIICKRNNSGNGYLGWDLYANNSNKLVARVSDNTTEFVITGVNSSINNSQIMLAAVAISQLGNLTLYLNGVVNGTPVSIATLGNSASMYNLTIGNRQTNPLYYPGLIGETQIILFNVFPANIVSIISQININRPFQSLYPNGAIVFWNDPKNGMSDKSGTGNNLISGVTANPPPIVRIVK